MKTILQLALYLPAIAFSQPTLNNVEDFSNGTILKFINCSTVSVNAGNAGASQVWDFSTLAANGDTITEWMILPSAAPEGSLYPTASLVEKYSDGSYVYMDKTASQNLMLGFSSPGINIKYPDPLLFAQRPVSFGSVFSDTFTSQFNANSYNFSGSGTITISADAYGTLILPNATYSNVLKIKSEQIQVDTILQFGTTYTTTVKVFTWFDANHTSALLKIDSTGSPNYSEKSVQYLLSESAVSVNETQRLSRQLRFYPNPASSEVNIECIEEGWLKVYNALGEMVKSCGLSQGKNKIVCSDLCPGMYQVTYETSIEKITGTLIIR